MKDWTYKNQTIKNIEQMPEDAFGFTYVIEHLPSGKTYVGKKQIRSYRNKKLGKKAKAKLKEERREQGIPGPCPKKVKVVKESDWKTYCSSNDWIKEQVEKGNEDDFEREIIQFYPDKKSLTYGELEYQIKNNVLKDDNCLNGTVLGKFYSKDVI